MTQPQDPRADFSAGVEALEAALASIPLPQKEGGYSLKEILQLHDQVSQPAAEPAPAAGVEVQWVGAQPAAEAESPVKPHSRPAANAPWGAMPLPTQSLGPQPAAPSPARGLPQIDPQLFATMADDSLALPDEAAEPEADTAPADDNQLERLQRSLATLNELEAQLDQLMAEATTSAAPDAQAWLGALVGAEEAGPETETPPHWAETLSLPAMVNPPAAKSAETDPVTAEATSLAAAADALDAALDAALAERLEPAPAYPFPGMREFRDDLEAAPAPAAPKAPAPAPAPAQVEPVSTSLNLGGHEVDLSQAGGLAECQALAQKALADFGYILPRRTTQNQIEAEVADLMAQVAAGAGIDEVIEIGRALADARARLAEVVVEQAAVHELIERLQQSRSAFDRCIGILQQI